MDLALSDLSAIHETQSRHGGAVQACGAAPAPPGSCARILVQVFSWTDFRGRTRPMDTPGPWARLTPCSRACKSMYSSPSERPAAVSATLTLATSSSDRSLRTASRPSACFLPAARPGLSWVAGTARSCLLLSMVFPLGWEVCGGNGNRDRHHSILRLRDARGVTRFTHLGPGCFVTGSHGSTRACSSPGGVPGQV